MKTICPSFKIQSSAARAAFSITANGSGSVPRPTSSGGGVISFLAPGADKPTRLRASTLGEGFGPEDIRAVIAGERPVPEIHDEAPPPPPRRVDFWIDIENRMRPGMGPGYKRAGPPSTTSSRWPTPSSLSGSGGCPAMRIYP